MSNIKYDKTVKNDEERSQLDIAIVVSPEEYARMYEVTAHNFASKVSMPGFRKGNVPITAVKSAHHNKISEKAFNVMIDMIVKDVLPQVEQKPISTVKINMNGADEEGTKFEFIISYAYRQSPKLPDISTIKVKRPSIEISEDEINQSMDMLLKNVNKQLGIEDENSTENEWTEEKVKSLKIENVNTIDELKTLVKGEIEKQKNYENEISYRASILDEIIKQSEINIPALIMEEMMARQEEDFHKRIEKLGFEYDKYIEEKKINTEDLKKEWVDLIKADLGREMILSQYAVEQNIDPTDEEIDSAVQTADPELKERYTPEGLRDYMRYILMNNIAFSKLYALVSEE